MSWFFGDYLQRLLDEKEWTVSKLAKKAQLSHVYMGHLIRGERSEGDKPSRISVETVTSLAKALDIPEYKLLLAYKGIDPDQAPLFMQESFNIYAEINRAAENQGVQLQQLRLETRNELETNVIRVIRKLLEPLVQEEIDRLNLN
jgi:transcriptional regulator with XRE-family HTH domain